MIFLDYKLLCELFEYCLDADYVTVENGGSYSVAVDRDVLYLFFEKSNGAEDWMNNLSYHAVSRGRALDEWYCHEGFLTVFNSILPYIETYITDARFKSIISVGYSHGAALTLLVHEQIYQMRPDIRDNCYSLGFGCPRVVFGTVRDEGARWRSFYMIRNGVDAVTHLPPRVLGYRHVGNLIKIGENDKYGGIEAHKAENYITELKNAARNSKQT